MTVVFRAGSPADATVGISVAPEGRSLLQQDNVGPLLAALEVITLTAASVIGGVLYHAIAFPGQLGDLKSFVITGLVVSTLYALVLHPHGYYSVEKLVRNGGRLYRPLLSWLSVFLVFTVFTFSFKMGDQFSRGATFLFLVLGIGVIVGLRLGASQVLRQAVVSGRLRGRRCVVLGDLANWNAVGAQDAQNALDRCVIANFEIGSTGESASTFEERLDQAIDGLVAFVRVCEVDEIMLALPGKDDRLVQHAIERVRVLPLPVYLIPEPNVCRLLRQNVIRFGPLCAVEAQRGPLSKFERTIKRFFDLVVASSALFALAPMFVMIAVLIKLDSRGPVFFRQKRVGFSGRTFRILKFRTMTTLDDGAIVTQATRHDPRVTRVGRFLRQTSLDELPQLINVILSDMSLVGPRPHAQAHDSQYEQLIADYAYRHHVKPGITGWAQVHGLRGETPTVDLMERRVEHDLWYIANWSFMLDIRTIGMTVGELMRQRNAY